MRDPSARGVGLRVLAGQGAQIDTTTAAGRLVFGIIATLAERVRFRQFSVAAKLVGPPASISPRWTAPGSGTAH